MEPVHKSRLAEAAARQLRGAIGGGQWQDRLPGSRLLCRSLRVSPPVLAEALDLLCREGLLQRDGPKRRLRITAQPPHGTSLPRTQRRTLLCLAPDAHWAVQPLWTSLLTKLTERLEEEGWEVKRRIIPYRAAAVRWDQLFAVEQPAAAVAVVGTPDLAAWALARGHRILFVGGNAGGLTIPRLYVKTRPLLRQAVQRLVKTGHHRICLPLAGRLETFQEEMRTEMAAAMAAAGLPYHGECHSPSTPYEGRAVFLDLLAKTWQEFRPTAMVLLDWHEVVALSCFLAQRGLRIPQDLSVIVLSYSPEMEWFSPALACYHYPVRRLTTLLERWVAAPPAEAARPFDHGLPATWHAGDSTAPPPPGFH